MRALKAGAWLALTEKEVKKYGSQADLKSYYIAWKVFLNEFDNQTTKIETAIETALVPFSNEFRFLPEMQSCRYFLELNRFKAEVTQSLAKYYESLSGDFSLKDQSLDFDKLSAEKQRKVADARNDHLKMLFSQFKDEFDHQNSLGQLNGGKRLKYKHRIKQMESIRQSVTDGGISNLDKEFLADLKDISKIANVLKKRPYREGYGKFIKLNL